MNNRTYCIDIDGTICSATTGRNYHEATPWKERIQLINKMYDRGDYIIYFTARGMVDLLVILMQHPRLLIFYSI